MSERNDVTPPAASLRPVFLLLSFGPGGAERQMRYLLQEYRRQGIPCLLVTGDISDTIHEELERVGVEIYRLNLPVRLSGFLDYVSWVRGVADSVRRWSGNIIQSFLPVPNLIAALAGKVSGVPSVLSERNVDIPHGRVSRYIRSRVYRLSAGMVCNSEAVRRWALSFFNLPEELYSVIHNGIPIPSSPPPERKSWSDQPHIITVASFKSQKGHSFLLEAWHKLMARWPRARLSLLGGGNSESVKKLIDAYDLHQSVTICPPASDVSASLANADVFCLPSIAEGMPNVIMEAMISGMPIVATTAGGTPELLKHLVSGCLVQPGSADALYEGIIRTLSEPDVSLGWGRKARQDIANFSIERLGSSYRQLHERVTGLKPRDCE